MTSAKRSVTLWSTWLATAHKHPHKVVIIEAESGRCVNCADLTAQAETASQRDWAGRRLAFCLPNGVDWFVTFLAIQKAGGIAVPLDPSLAGHALQKIARQLDAELLPTTERSQRTKVSKTAAHPCLVKVTSGTTGTLTTIPCQPHHMLADGRQVCRTMRITDRDCNLAIIPLGHSYGLGNLVMPLIQQATSIICTNGLVPRHLLRVIEDYHVTVLPTVPAVLRALSLTPKATIPQSLRLVISAGAPLAAETAQQFHDRFGKRIHNFYGSSETGGICFDRTGRATLTGRSVGRPMLQVTVTLNRTGRVTVKSAAVAMPRHRHTLADLGEWTGRGELQLLGRVGTMANIGGRKVSPAEIEHALRNLKAISDVWVTVLRDKRGHDYLGAAVETKLSAKEIEAALARQLPTWKLPKRYLVQPALPRTDRGKLDTVALRKQLELPPSMVKQTLRG